MNLNGVAVAPQQYSMYTKTNGQNTMAQPTINRYVAFDPYAPAPSTLAAPVHQHQTLSPPPSLPSLPSHPSSYQPAVPAVPIAPISSTYPPAQHFAQTASSSSLARSIFQDRSVDKNLETTQTTMASFLPTHTYTSPSAPVIETFLTSKPAEFIPFNSSDSSQDEFCEVEIVGSNSSSVL